MEAGRASFLLAALAPLVVAPFYPATWRAGWSAAVPAGVLALLVTVMLWPSAGVRRYLAYKTPLFIFTLLFEVFCCFRGSGRSDWAASPTALLHLNG